MAAQVALSLVLMIAGSMLIRSAVNSVKMDTGYDSQQVLDLDLQFPEAKYTPARKIALVGELRRRLAALPGVAALTSARPPGDLGFLTAAAPLVQSVQQGVQRMHYAYVQSNYFQTLGIPLIGGRSFQSERSIVLSESAAKQLWPDRKSVV